VNPAWEVGELLALASVGALSQVENLTAYDGSEERVVFGADPQQYVLVYGPSSSAPARGTVVCFVYGGGWNMGDPDLYRFAGRFLAEMGYPVVLASYRLTPENTFPAQLEDVAASLAIGVHHLAHAGVTMRRLVLGGHSAGAQLAALVAYDPRVPRPKRPVLEGFFSMSGPLDFSLCDSGSIRTMLDDYVGGLPDEGIADPIRYADPDAPIRALLIHGAQDPTVDAENSRSFAAALNSGPVVRAELHVLPERHHSDVLSLFLEESDESKLLADWLAAIDAG